jgi:hypothetical protein
MPHNATSAQKRRTGMACYAATLLDRGGARLAHEVDVHLGRVLLQLQQHLRESKSECNPQPCNAVET